MLKDSHLGGGEILSTHYRYDKLNRLIQAHNAHSELRFGYDHNRLVKEQLIHLDKPLSSGISRSQSKDGAAQITEHRYDVLGNRIQTILPTGEILNRLYYGSGHLHHINLDGTALADIERDALHRPIERTIGKLNTQFQLDPLGRLKQQIVQPNGHNKADPAVLIGRRYQYDTTGNLIRTDEQTNGSRDYTYDALGRITQSEDEHYRYDPAHNLTDGSRIGGNRLTQYQGTSYRYDPLGNLIEKQQNDGEIQHYRYNADNQLTEAEIHKPGESPVQYRYRYDPMGRRIAKVHPDGSEIQYLWDGSRLLQEYRKDRTYTYVYTEDRNYEPLAQITTYNGSDKAREILYYHNDQIGIPREMTDGEGNIVWGGDYSGWGKLTREERLKSDIYQPIRLQNQHYDEETGLHYNFFRYYDPEIGRFTQQDPIKLLGGKNLYAVAWNAISYIDPLGLSSNDYVDEFGDYYGFTAATIKGEASSIQILKSTLDDMKTFNLTDTDQFFHCTAFCKVSKSIAPDKGLALMYGRVKEFGDWGQNLIGSYGRKRLTNSEMIDDMNKDMGVNEYGFKCPSNQTCAERCEKYLNPNAHKTKEILKNKGYL